jgi:hypothetical protein
MSQQQVVIVREEHYGGEDSELTMCKTMLFTPGDGLEAYDHRTGQLTFRFLTYGRDRVCCQSSPSQSKLAASFPHLSPWLPSCMPRLKASAQGRATGQRIWEEERVHGFGAR